MKNLGVLAGVVVVLAYGTAYAGMECTTIYKKYGDKAWTLYDSRSPSPMAAETENGRTYGAATLHYDNADHYAGAVYIRTDTYPRYAYHTTCPSAGVYTRNTTQSYLTETYFAQTYLSFRSGYQLLKGMGGSYGAYWYSSMDPYAYCDMDKSLVSWVGGSCSVFSFTHGGARGLCSIPGAYETAVTTVFGGIDVISQPQHPGMLGNMFFSLPHHKALTTFYGIQVGVDLKPGIGGTNATGLGITVSTYGDARPYPLLTVGAYNNTGECQNWAGNALNGVSASAVSTTKDNALGPWFVATRGDALWGLETDNWSATGPWPVRY